MNENVKNSQAVAIKKNIGDQVIARVNALCEAGFSMPKDFNYVNAIKMTLLKLQDLKDKNGKSALEVCTPTSVQKALFGMVCKGLNAALNQIYFIIRGDQLCAQDSYFGKVLMVKRIYPNWDPVAVVIREGDTFKYGVNTETGKKHLIEHTQELENIDKGFVGAYMYLPNGELYIMTKKQILTAWSKSSSTSQAVHKTFEEKMILKTVINSGCNMVINATPEYQIANDENTSEDNQYAKLNSGATGDNNIEFEEFEEVAKDNAPQKTEEPKKNASVAGKQPNDDINSLNMEF